MIKKLLCLCLIILMTLSLSGCWDYLSLNDIEIVAGISIDKNQTNGEYQLAFEILDLENSTKDSGVSTKIIDSTGTTLFDAIRNAKKRLTKKLYFGAAQVIVLSGSVAKNDGVNSIIDFFLRDTELRETTKLVVSQEKSAKAILSSDYTDSRIISYQISTIVEKDKNVTLSTVNTDLYQIYNTLNSKGVYLTLPAFKNTLQDDKTISESNGTAIFKKDKLVGYLSARETEYYLFVVNAVKGGIIDFVDIDKDIERLSLEIENNKTKMSFSYSNNQIKMLIEPNVEVYIGEVFGETINSDNERMEKIQEITGAILEKRISNVIQKLQTEYQTDIFGFGNNIYKNDPKLWGEISDNWDSMFVNMEFEVKPKIVIVNTAVIK